VTTPPCLEDVNWFLVAEPFPISAKYLTKFRNLWGDNNEFGGLGNWRET